jgi:ABC-type polar amino acid transport system ATPase subunit
LTSRIAVPEPEVSLAIQGAGGYGKSTILRELRKQDEGWLTVDDAHLHPPPRLAELRQSFKTVEHHVARRRQRPSCGSRSELLARLRSG